MAQPVSELDLLIIGAGIGGLTAAMVAHDKKRRFLVLEASSRVGGSIATVEKNGFTLELGPNTVQWTPELDQLVSALPVQDQIRMADAKSARFVQFRGRLHQVPLSPPAILTTSLLSIGGRVRLFRERSVPARPDDESFFDFMQRRFGIEVAERLAAPFVSGIYAGDARQLSVEAAFPTLKAAEREHGSVIKGMMKKKKGGPRKKSGLMSMHGGLETLPRAIAAVLGDRLRRNEKPVSLETAPEGWTVRTANATYQARQIILTTPSFEAAPLIRPFDSAAADALDRVAYAGIAVLHFAIEKKHVRHPLNGFGYLVAPSENAEILGCLWNSSLFPAHAPADQHLLTVFMGGARHPEKLTAPDDLLITQAQNELGRTLGTTAELRCIHLTRVKRAIPQYGLGYPSILGALAEAEKRRPTLRLLGNYRGGVSVGDVVKNARAGAESLLN